MNRLEEFETLDATIFNGEILYTNFEEVKNYIASWDREIKRHDSITLYNLLKACQQAAEREEKRCTMPAAINEGAHCYHCDLQEIIEEAKKVMI